MSTEAIAALLGQTEGEAQELEFEDIEQSLSILLEHYERREAPSRHRMVAKWKRNEHYFRGIQHIFYDEVARDWRIPSFAREVDPELTVEPSDYSYVVNIYRPHCEAIVSALSVGLPTVRFFPGNAEDPSDIATSDSYTKISELIYRHNRAKLLLIQALYTYFNQGLIAIWNREEFDYKYGENVRPVYDMVDQEVNHANCPGCGSEVDLPEAPPGMMAQAECPNCGPVAPEMSTSVEKVSQQVDEKREPKCRQILSVHGPLSVKLPFYVKDVDKVPYLIYEEEVHYSKAREMFPDNWDEIKASGPSETYERYGRQLLDGHALNNEMVTIKHCWFRPWAFNVLDKEEAKEIQEKFPTGMYVPMINGKAMYMRDQGLDDCWTISFTPTSPYLHSNAPGNDLVYIQDMENDLANLTMETIRYGIPEVFVDPDTIDLDAYKEVQAAPGQITAAVPRPGMGLDSSFYSTRTTSLPKEAESFQRYLTEKGQFVPGSFPSIYGGPNIGGSKTLGEYKESRIRAMQRLGITWEVATTTWTYAIDKAVRAHAKRIRTGEADNSYVQLKDEKYANVNIPTESLYGNVGEAVPESSDQFPASWEQRRQTLFDLLSMNITPINLAIFHPKNINMVSRLLGFTDIYIPGLDDVRHQLEENQALANAVPNPDGSPSIPIDLELDDHEVHGQITKCFLLSPAGIELREKNPGGYMNVLAHYKAHAFIAQQQAAMAETEPGASSDNGGGAPPAGSPPEAGQTGSTEEAM